MKQGRLLAAGIGLATVLLIAIGTFHPVAPAVAYAGGQKDSCAVPRSTPLSAAEDLGTQIRLQALGKAYSSLSNKAEFSEDEFLHDLTGQALSLRTYATLDSFEVLPLHQTASEAEVAMKLHWSSVVGNFDDRRDLRVVRVGDRWAVQWPLVKEPHVRRR